MSDHNNLAEQRLKEEFDTIVQTLVNRVHQKAADTIDAATEGIQVASHNINTSSKTLKETAEDARQSINTMREIKTSFQKVQEEVQHLIRSHNQLDSKVEQFNYQTARQIEEVVKQLKATSLQTREMLKVIFIWLISVSIIGFTFIIFKINAL